MFFRIPYLFINSIFEHITCIVFFMVALGITKNTYKLAKSTSILFLFAFWVIFFITYELITKETKLSNQNTLPPFTFTPNK